MVLLEGQLQMCDFSTISKSWSVIFETAQSHLLKRSQLTVPIPSSSPLLPFSPSLRLCAPRCGRLGLLPAWKEEARAVHQGATEGTGARVRRQ